MSQTTVPHVVARVLADRAPGRHLLVGIDGRDGAGKTTFAEALARQLRQGMATDHVAIIHLDDFHNPRAIRYRQGKHSPLGFFEDSYNYDAFERLVIGPIRSCGGAEIGIVAQVHDVASDAYVRPVRELIPAESVVIVEGIFLHRDELRRMFDLTILLDVAPEIAIARLHQRDGSSLDPTDSSLSRYTGGQQIYFERCSPRERANLVIDDW